MPKVIGKYHLCNTPNFRDNFGSLQGLDGKDIFQRYSSLKNLIEKEISSDFRHFLAEPVLTDDRADIEWHCEKYSDTPVEYLKLNSDSSEYENYRVIKEKTIIHFSKIISQLNNEDKSSEASLLADSIKFIDDRFIFCFDNKVVLGVWGISLKKNATDYLGVVAKTHGVKHQIKFEIGENARSSNDVVLKKVKGYVLSKAEIPDVEPKDGYKFIGWDKDPLNHEIIADVIFKALFEKIEVHDPVVATTKRHSVKFEIGSEAINEGNIELFKNQGDTISDS